MCQEDLSDGTANTNATVSHSRRMHGARHTHSYVGGRLMGDEVCVHPSVQNQGTEARCLRPNVRKGHTSSCTNWVKRQRHHFGWQSLQESRRSSVGARKQCSPIRPWHACGARRVDHIQYVLGGALRWQVLPPHVTSAAHHACPSNTGATVSARLPICCQSSHIQCCT